MKLITLLTMLACSTLPALAQAQEPKEMPSLDYALSENANNGQTLKLTGCRISHVSINSALCNINGSGSDVGNIYLEVNKMDKSALKDAILKCAGMKGYQSPDCDASIIGVAKPKGPKPIFQINQIIWDKN